MGSWITPRLNGVRRSGGIDKMSKFSLKNGLKLTWAHLHDEQMFMGWFMFAVIGLAFYANEALSFKSATIGFAVYEVMLNCIYIGIRCYDDPVKLGWCEE